jgi:tetratricopeptide (TPR) repeat protein
MRPIARRAALLALCLAAARALPGQGVPPPLVQAFDLERMGRNVEAAQRFRVVLRLDPTNMPALLGLERVLTPLGQLDSLLGPVAAALARQPTNRMVRAIELRAWAGLGRPDSLTAAARRWLQADSTNPDVYREWAFAVAQHGDLRAAEAILNEGLNRLGGETLTIELAQMAGLAGQWADAARYWRQVLLRNDGLASSAALNLERTPENLREGVLHVLLREPPDSQPRRVAAELLLGWNRAGEAWPLLDASLPQSPAAVPLLQRFADRAAIGRTKEGLRARGFAEERLGALLSGPAAARARVEAARAFAEAGDQNAAERVLEKVATDGSGDPATAASAMATLIGVMSQSGRVTEAEEKFTQWIARMPDEQATALRRQLAQAWLKQGDPDRADRLLSADSSGEALGLKGWIALYRGDLHGATDRFRAAGPYSGTRAAATERAEVAAVLQRIRGDSNPDLGRAFQWLGRGDTARAVAGLTIVAATLPPSRGRGDVLALAGRLAAAQRQDTVATALLVAAVAADSLGPAAPGAELALAQIEARRGQRPAAMKRLEHLIVTYGESAVVPQARRLLDQLRGAVPES